MRKTILTVLFITLLGGEARPAPEFLQKEEKKKEKSFCAGIGTVTPIYEIGKKDLMIEFMVFNDGTMIADPRYVESELLINGQPMKGFLNKMINGPGPDSRQQVLGPGQSLHVSKPFTRTLTKPGTYKLVWKNEYFESPEFTIRVVNSR